MDYTNAPATALVATHCALCGRALLDAASVESGMGPTCRARVLRDAPTEHRAEVNALVARIAAKVLAIKDLHQAQALWVVGGRRGAGHHPLGITIGQVRALAACCLTQAADKPKRKRPEVA